VKKHRGRLLDDREREFLWWLFGGIGMATLTVFLLLLGARLGSQLLGTKLGGLLMSAVFVVCTLPLWSRWLVKAGWVEYEE
jgi:hypothetical protein